MAVSGRKALQMEVAGKCIYFCCDVILKLAREFKVEAADDQTQILVRDIFNRLTKHGQTYRQPKVLSGKEQRHRIRHTDPINCFADAFCCAVGIKSGIVFFNRQLRAEFYDIFSHFLKNEISEDDFGTERIFPYASDYVVALADTACDLVDDADAPESVMENVGEMHDILRDIVTRHYLFFPYNDFYVLLKNHLNEYVRF